MSVKIMSLVWESGRYEGGSLLVLLALADWADDDGECWPGIAKLSAKARLGRRQTQNVLRQLEADGVLVTILNVGRGHQNHYLLKVQNLRLLENAQSETQKAQSTTENVQPTAPDPLVLDPLVEPSVPHALPEASPEAGTEPAFNQARSSLIASSARSGRSSRAVVEIPRPVPDKVPMTPELRAWLDSKGWTDDDLADAVETWRLKRKASGIKHTGEQWIADLMGFLKTYREMRAGGRR